MKKIQRISKIAFDLTKIKELNRKGIENELELN